MNRKIIFALLIVLNSNSLFALPLFSLRSGASCQSCHINPTGKGMRNSFGVSFSQDELPLQMFRAETEFEEFTPKLNDFFTIGFDARTLFYQNSENKKSQFFQMQGDLYFDLKINKVVRLYFDKGLRDGFELFALAKNLPAKGFLKVGQFTPSFGIKTDDHNTWTRSEIGFGERSEDAGLEIGFAPDDFLITAGIFNGNPGGLGFPPKKSKAVILRTEYQNSFSFLNFMLGGSYYLMPEFANKRIVKNYFGGFTIDKNFTLMYEFVNLKTNLGFFDDFKDINNLSMHYQVTTGFDLRYSFETKTMEDHISSEIQLSPSNILHGGAKEIKYTRHSIGFSVYPVSGVEILNLYRINLEPTTQIENNEYQLVFHFFI